jgi:hypothetical protein
MRDNDPLEIDEDRLDQEWKRQPRLALWAGDKQADAQYAVDNAKNQLELIEAQLTMAVRQTPSEYSLDKITEASIKATVILQPQYQAAAQAINDAQNVLGHLKAMCNGVEHKKRALEKLVDLKLMAWRSEPKLSTTVPQDFRTETTKESVRKPLQKPKK